MNEERHIAIIGIPTKYTTLNQLNKENLEDTIAKLNAIQHNNLAKLFKELYVDKLNYIGESYETNHHSS